ncbi:VOC family protein [Dictyobacter formicarum]|uniref:Glyoxalase-like domain-containing protein n=1 Tax=Dictyobacter formicarum TaxID=2778368 RepID=A0ABQ3VNF7_9CHLR|nr:VOC family protein [Dictyobacter formicarum]GHO87343.1 hypothetical protein KSZ_53490 [Dictyobacter formicarum]
MLTALDHIIIGVHDLPQADETFRQRLGLVSSGGGNHPSGGTANRIIVIGDTYLELIAVRAPDEAQQSMLDRLAQGNGYLNCVLASNDIEADSRAMFQRGVAVIGPNQGSLKSADGVSRSWLRTDIERPDLAQHYPFIIQHDSSGEERRKRLAGGQTPPIHPLGVQTVLSVTLAVENLDEASRRFQHIYGLHPSEPHIHEQWSARVVTLSLADSTQSVELAELLPASRAPLPQDATLATHLHQLGESLYRITLRVEDLQATRHYLDAHKAGYTVLEDGQQTLWIHPKQAYGALIVLTEEKIY